LLEVGNELQKIDGAGRCAGRSSAASFLPLSSTHWFAHLHCDIVRKGKKMLVTCRWSDKDSYSYTLSAHCNGNSRNSESFAMTNTSPTMSLQRHPEPAAETPKIKCMRTVNSFYRGLATELNSDSRCIFVYVRQWHSVQCTVFLFPASYCSRNIRSRLEIGGLACPPTCTCS
jgi:hypothetical protein